MILSRGWFVGDSRNRILKDCPRSVPSPMAGSHPSLAKGLYSIINTQASMDGSQIIEGSEASAHLGFVPLG